MAEIKTGKYEYFQKLARFVTEEPITLSLGDGSFTVPDTKHIEIPSPEAIKSRPSFPGMATRWGDIMDKMDKPDKDNFVTAYQHNILYHEAGHVKFTPLARYQELARGDPLLGTAINALEDNRIESEMARTYKYSNLGTRLDTLNKIMLAEMEVNCPDSIKSDVDLSSVIICASRAVYGLESLPENPLAEMARDFIIKSRRPGTTFDDIVSMASQLLEGIPEKKKGNKPGEPGEPEKEKPEGKTPAPGESGKEKAPEGKEKTPAPGDEPSGKDSPAPEVKKKPEPHKLGPDVRESLLDKLKKDSASIVHQFEKEGIDLTEPVGGFSDGNERSKKAINEPIAVKLGTTLAQVKDAKKSKRETLDFEGESVSIPEYLAYLETKQYGKMYETFARDAPDFHIVFCLDQSGSMGHDKMESAKTAVATLAKACDMAGIRTSVVSFNQYTQIVKTASQSTENSGIGDVYARGENDVALSVRDANSLLETEPDNVRKAVIILTDGGDHTAIDTANYMSQHLETEYFYIHIQPGEFDRQFPDIVSGKIKREKALRSQDLKAGFGGTSASRYKSGALTHFKGVASFSGIAFIEGLADIEGALEKIVSQIVEKY